MENVDSQVSLLTCVGFLGDLGAFELERHRLNNRPVASSVAEPREDADKYGIPCHAHYTVYMGKQRYQEALKMRAFDFAICFHEPWFLPE